MNKYILASNNIKINSKIVFNNLFFSFFLFIINFINFLLWMNPDLILIPPNPRLKEGNSSSFILHEYNFYIKFKLL